MQSDVTAVSIPVLITEYAAAVEAKVLAERKMDDLDAKYQAATSTKRSLYKILGFDKAGEPTETGATTPKAEIRTIDLATYGKVLMKAGSKFTLSALREGYAKEAGVPVKELPGNPAFEKLGTTNGFIERTADRVAASEWKGNQDKRPWYFKMTATAKARVK